MIENDPHGARLGRSERKGQAYKSFALRISVHMFDFRF